MGWIGVLVGVAFTGAVFYALLTWGPKLVNRRLSERDDEIDPSVRPVARVRPSAPARVARAVLFVGAILFVILLAGMADGAPLEDASGWAAVLCIVGSFVCFAGVVVLSLTARSNSEASTVSDGVA